MTETQTRILHLRSASAFALVAFLSVAVLIAKYHVDTVGPASVIQSRTERLIERHGCWTGQAPHGVIPGHAVVSRPGHAATYAPAGPALDAVFGEGHRSLTVHAFCR